MRSAPSVVYPVERCAFYVVVLAMLGALSASIGLFFLFGFVLRTNHPSGWMAPLAGLCLWLVWCVVALTTWLRSPEGALQWDASAYKEEGGSGAWAWHEAGAALPMPLSRVECALDLQSRILLRLRTSGVRHCWVWAERRSQSERWMDLRRAIVCSRD